MRRCPDCDKVYDASEYTHCPYCSGELDDSGERYYKDCPECSGVMYWEDGCWRCTNCGHEIESDEDDYDGIIEV